MDSYTMLAAAYSLILTNIIMNFVFAFLFTFISVTCFSQNGLSLFGHEQKPDITPSYLLVYQVYEDYMHISGFAASPSKRWVTNSIVFETETELFRFLNSTLYNKIKDVRFSENQIVGVWNLQSAEKVEIELKTETVRKEREVIIEADEWENKWFEKSKN